MEKAAGNYFIIFPKNDFGNAQIFMRKQLCSIIAIYALKGYVFIFSFSKEKFLIKKNNNIVLVLQVENLKRMKMLQDQEEEVNLYLENAFDWLILLQSVDCRLSIKKLIFILT